MSDADDEILITCRFTSPVTVKKLMVIGGEQPGQQPSSVSCFVDVENMDFTTLAQYKPVQTFQMPNDNSNGDVELLTTLRHFTNISTLTLLFKGNLSDGETSSLRYIGMQGDHTHYRREAVNTVYEVLCNGQDICQPEDAKGTSAHFH